MVPARHASRACEALRGAKDSEVSMYYTYILESIKTKKRYIGFSDPDLVGDT